MVLPFEPLSLSFSHVNYYVPLPKVSTQDSHDHPGNLWQLYSNWHVFIPLCHFGTLMENLLVSTPYATAMTGRICTAKVEYLLWTSNRIGSPSSADDQHDRPRQGGEAAGGCGRDHHAAAADRLQWSLPAWSPHSPAGQLRRREDHTHGRAVRKEDRCPPLPQSAQYRVALCQDCPHSLLQGQSPRLDFKGTAQHVLCRRKGDREHHGWRIPERRTVFCSHHGLLSARRRSCTVCKPLPRQTYQIDYQCPL